MDYSKTWLYHQTDNRDHLLDAKKRLSFIVNNISNLKGITNIIDLGFGDGFLLTKLCKKGFNVSGIDFIKENVTLTKEATGLGESLKFGSVTSIPFASQSFDLAISTEMFEHLTVSDLQIGLKEIHRVLRSPGFLVVTVPYDEKLEKKQVCCPNCGCKFHQWGHQQSFNDTNLSEKFSRYFSILKVKKLYPMSSNLNLFGYIELLTRMIRKRYKGYYILLQKK